MIIDIDDTGKKRWVVGRDTRSGPRAGKQTVFIRRSGGGVTVTQRRRADRKTPQQNAFVYFESVAVHRVSSAAQNSLHLRDLL